MVVETPLVNFEGGGGGGEAFSLARTFHVKVNNFPCSLKLFKMGVCNGSVDPDLTSASGMSR